MQARVEDLLRGLAPQVLGALVRRYGNFVPRGEFAPPPGDERLPEEDDTLTLLFLCAHPALTPASQLALTLRAVGGLTSAEIARAFQRATPRRPVPTCSAAT